ncbi:uncharacterized protein LOC143268503 [Peromyscus maniculatus bairdii]|uniref:uncharacterized protein LOC143268503 n=1 Tax=Peromyscus maniculatus bairdii TaxID=230844 RepID=UPI003FD0E25B
MSPTLTSPAAISLWAAGTGSPSKEGRPNPGPWSWGDHGHRQSNLERLRSQGLLEEPPQPEEPPPEGEGGGGDADAEKQEAGGSTADERSRQNEVPSRPPTGPEEAGVKRG